MKNKIKTINIIFVLLIILTQTLFSQRTTDRHSLALWATAGYSSINNHSPSTQALGGLGNSVGIGYEYNHRRGFLLQTGLEFSFYNSLMNRNDTLYIADMISTTGFPYEGYFAFSKISDHQTILNIAPTLLLGNNFRNGFFFLVGGKLMLNISGTSETTSEITTTAYFDNIIGDNNDGMLGGMPNHGLTTAQRLYRSSLSINPTFVGSFEIGYLFPTENLKNRMRYRLSAFVDYGFSSSKDNTNYDLIINPSTTGEYLPVINGYLHYDVGSAFINTLYVGAKFTILFNIPEKCKCFWQTVL